MTTRMLASAICAWRWGRKLSELCLWLQKAHELDLVRMRQPPAPPAPGTPSPPSPPPPPLSSSRPDSFAKEDGDEICGDCGEASPSAACPTAALAEAALTAVCHDEAPCGHEERTQQRCQQSSATGAQWRLAARAEGVPVSDLGRSGRPRACLRLSVEGGDRPVG